MESASAVAHHAASGGDKGLKRNAIGYLSNLVISVASTAPGYSLAATLGFIVAVQGVGLQAPAVLIVSFIPMLCIAFAYRYMNRADPDCGTSFTWVTKGLGPQLGWLSGWAIVAADIIVMASLAVIAGTYTFLLFGWNSAADSTAAVIIAGVIWIALMTWICYVGIELSARTQRWLLTAELGALALFAVVALIKVYANNPAGSLHVQASWFSPFAVSSWSALADGMLLGIFIYWGWDSGVAVNEESEASEEGPGRAAVVSTLVLVLTYVIVGTAAQAYGGPKLLIDNADDVLSVLGGKVFGSPLDKLLIIAVLTSASASTQTTILPTARTTLSMARQRSIPKIFGEVHPRYQTPTWSTLLMGGVSAIWLVALLAFNPSQNVLGDSISALGFSICFYYGMTGIACAVYYRRELFKSVQNFLFAGLVPLIGAGILGYIFVKAFHDYSQAGFNYSKPILGIETPIFIGIGALVLGAVLMVISMFSYRDFFRRRPEAAEEGLLEEPVEHAAAHI
ncbi:MAG: APC family permease [Thermoleophilaceae bacterium]